MKATYMAPELQILKANTGMLLQVSSEIGISYGGVDEKGNLDPAVKNNILDLDFDFNFFK